MTFVYSARCSCGTTVRIEVADRYNIGAWKERIEKWETLHSMHWELEQFAKIADGSPQQDSAP